MNNTKLAGLCLAIAGLLCSPAAFAVARNQCVINIGGATAAGLENSGSPLNSVIQRNLGPNAVVTAMGASGTLTTYFSAGGFLAFDAQIRFSGSDPSTSFTYQPGAGSGESPLYFSRSMANGISLPTGPTGMLTLLFYNTWTTAPSVGFRYEDGSSITVEYTGGNPDACTTVVEPVNTCATEGYKGAQLTWCKNICENGLTGQVLDTWIHRWINRYRDLPACAAGGGEPGGTPQ